MKNLIYIPIVHTEIDLGSMSEFAKKEYLARYGEGKWEEHIRIINETWNGLRGKIFSLNLPFKKLKIYQDGLPVCGRELEIVREVAGMGSPNHKIILELAEKGARLEGTEDKELLIQEYNNLKRVYELADTAQRTAFMQNYKKTASELIAKRDKFIAERVESTLAEHEIGLLFIGLEHAADKYLKNVKISYLIHRLPFRERYEVTTHG